MNDNLEERIEKEKQVIVVSKIHYNEKEYIRALKNMRNGIKYIYYEVTDNEVNEVNDEKLINQFKQMYEGEPSNIIY